MKIEYNVTLEDCLALNSHLITTLPEVKKEIRKGQFSWSIWPFVGVTSFTIIKDIPLAKALIIIAIVTFILSVPAFLLFPIYYKSHNRKRIKKMCESGKVKGITGSHTISITEEYFKEETEFNETSIPWKAIDRIETTLNHIFVFTNEVTAYIIPRHSLEAVS